MCQAVHKCVNKNRTEDAGAATKSVEKLLPRGATRCQCVLTVELQFNGKDSRIRQRYVVHFRCVLQLGVVAIAAVNIVNI